MKRTTAIFFLLFLTISQTGHILLYCVQLRHIKSLVREEILAGVQERFCSVIEANENIRWEEAGEEFSLNGDWFDVVAAKKIQGKTFFYCLNDRNEAQLVKAFASLIASAASGKSKQAIPNFHVTDQYILFHTPVLAGVQAIPCWHARQATGLAQAVSDIRIPPPRSQA